MKTNIKEKLQNLIDIDTGSIRNKYLIMEKLITVMLEDYIRKQGKTVTPSNSSYEFKGYDMFIPDGFDKYEGNTAIEIKWIRNQAVSMHAIYDTIGRVAMRDSEIKNLIFAIVGEVSQKYKDRIIKEQNNINFSIVIWDIDDLVEIFEKNETLFFDTYDNISKIFIAETINNGFSRNQYLYINKRNKYFRELQTSYNKDDLVLFLGAGVSSDAHIATWNTLISKLFVALIDIQLEEKGITLDESIKNNLVEEIKKQNNSSPLLQTRFLKQGLDKEFENTVRQILYKEALKTSDLLGSIGQLCVPQRGKVGIKAIVNYNFDDLIEKNLERMKLKYKSVYNEGEVVDQEDIGIYHVHGFLPQNNKDYKDLAKSLLIFSEDGYHKLMLEPYNWANLTQLNFLLNNTCLFIGLSMTDPNMRRLLEIAAQKTNDGEYKHYAILKRFKISNEGDSDLLKFEQINEELQEAVYKDLGVNVIWVDEYTEIPQLLLGIKSRGQFNSN